MKSISEVIRGLTAPPPGAVLPRPALLWALPGGVLSVALTLYLAAGYVEVDSWPGAAATLLVVCAAALTVGLLHAAADDHDRLGRAWAFSHGAWAVGAAALVAADTGKAGAVAPAAWLYVVLLAFASRYFGRTYISLLSLAAAALVLLAEFAGELAGYGADYQATLFVALVLLAAGLLFTLASPGQAFQRLESREAGRLSARRLEEAARGSAAAIALFDQAGRLRFASPALERWLGDGDQWLTSPEGAEGSSRAAALAAALGGRPSRLEFRASGDDGRDRDIDGVVFPLDEGAGLVAIDVTDLHEIQAQLPRIQRMETLGLIAGGLAHDFNNLLAVVRGNLDAMESAIGGSADARLVLDETTKACERAAAVLRRLLDYARPRDLEIAPVGVAGLLEETATLARGLLPPSVELEVDLHPSEELVEGDPAALQQVLLNLIVNSRDAMPDGGRIALRTGPAEGPPAVSGDLYRVISVHDTGAGMDGETLARAFEPFFTTKEAGKGTGLGLTTARSIVESLGGSLTAASTPGQGTTVSVRLPAVPSGSEVPG